MVAHRTATVFPTCVGMNRSLIQTLFRCFGVPHMRGDEPIALDRLGNVEACVPHMRGDEPK